MRFGFRLRRTQERAPFCGDGTLATALKLLSSGRGWLLQGLQAAPAAVDQKSDSYSTGDGPTAHCSLLVFWGLRKTLPEANTAFFFAFFCPFRYCPLRLLTGLAKVADAGLEIGCAFDASRSACRSFPNHLKRRRLPALLHRRPFALPFVDDTNKLGKSLRHTSTALFSSSLFSPLTKTTFHDRRPHDHTKPHRPLPPPP